MVNHNDVKILEINYRRPTLNDVFLHLTARELRDQLEETVPLPQGEVLGGEAGMNREFDAFTEWSTGGLKDGLVLGPEYFSVIL